MSKPVDLYSNYGQFTERVLESVRKETFGEDIGQNSWLTAEEFQQFLSTLQLSPGDHVLEVASGSGGPALYLSNLTNCKVTGIDANEGAIQTATATIKKNGKQDMIRLRLTDANASLPFEPSSFDAVICIDAMNHLPDRSNVLKEWHRVLREGKRALFTDPVVITGPVTNEELAVRSSIGVFLFVPDNVNEMLLKQAGFRLLDRRDASDNAAIVSERWGAARERHKQALLEIEGEERFYGLQNFFATVHRLSKERRLSRIVYLVEKSGK